MVNKYEAKHRIDDVVYFIINDTIVTSNISGIKIDYTKFENFTEFTNIRYTIRYTGKQEWKEEDLYKDIIDAESKLAENKKLEKKCYLDILQKRHKELSAELEIIKSNIRNVDNLTETEIKNILNPIHVLEFDSTQLKERDVK